MNPATARFVAPDRYYADAPGYLCGWCELPFNWNDMVEIGNQVYCHECAAVERCVSCDGVSRDTVATPDGRLCPDCVMESAGVVA